jgi:hypothetical protein
MPLPQFAYMIKSAHDITPDLATDVHPELAKAVILWKEMAVMNNSGFRRCETAGP